MFDIGDKVKCNESGLIGVIDDKEWENGWQYTIITDDGKFFYRMSHQIRRDRK